MPKGENPIQCTFKTRNLLCHAASSLALLGSVALHCARKLSFAPPDCLPALSGMSTPEVCLMDFQLNFAKGKHQQKTQVGNGCEFGHFVSQLSPCRDPSSWLQPPLLRRTFSTQPLCLQVLGRIPSLLRI